MNKKNTGTADVLMIILSVVLTLGVTFVFHACAVKEDGSFMSCHWAEKVVFGLGCVMTVISLEHLCAGSPKTKMGIGMALLPIEIFTAFVPGVTVKLCMMNNMRCHTAMRPAVIVICVILAIVTAVDIVIQKKKEDAGK